MCKNIKRCFLCIQAQKKLYIKTQKVTSENKDRIKYKY